MRTDINGALQMTKAVSCHEPEAAAPLSRVERLSAQLLRDRAAQAEPARSQSMACFSCGRSFTYRGPRGDDSGRFCSVRCRECYDAGHPAYDPDYASKNNPRWYNLPIGPHGFYIDCAGCGKRFDSKGLRCCSAECERRARERGDNAELMGEVGIDRPVKRKCQQCRGDIPNWRNGRRVSKATKFCSKRCSNVAARAGNGSQEPPGHLDAPNVHSRHVKRALLRARP